MKTRWFLLVLVLFGLLIALFSYRNLLPVFGQSVEDPHSPNTSQPVAFVQSLYRQVVARHPLGLPYGENWKVFAPFLSTALIRQIELDRSCQDDWIKQTQNQEQVEKAPFAWGETGLFSGEEMLSEPSSFKIVRTESNRADSFRVYVQLTKIVPNAEPFSWDAVVRLKMEEKKLVVYDIVFLKGKEVPWEYRLSAIRTEGCDGAHWVGYKEPQTQPR